MNGRPFHSAREPAKRSAPRAAAPLPVVLAIAVLLVGLIGAPAGARQLGIRGAPVPTGQPPARTPAELAGVDIVERLGELAELDVLLINDAGQMVRFGDYFNNGPMARGPSGRAKPAILALVYYDCPVVCVVVMEHLRAAMNMISYIVGEDFNVLVVSIDHTNTTDMALGQKLASVFGYNKPQTDAVRAGWAFHTATAGNVRRLADSVGFKYTFIPEAGEYAHAPAIMVLTPEGRVARYFYGLAYHERAGDIQLSLVEASQGEIRPTLLDRLILYCFHFDPTRGTYTMQATMAMRIGGAASMLGIAGLVLILRLQERARARRRAAAGGTPPKRGQRVARRAGRRTADRRAHAAGAGA